jgi:hypothetical protein
MKRGIDPDPKTDEDDDKPRYWIEDEDSNPYKGRQWGDEVVVTRG